MKQSQPRITLSMIVRNEAHRYLRQVLEAVREFIDDALIIDDGSTDSTAEICREVLQCRPLHLIKNSISQFHNEQLLRKQQWQETIRLNPDWILNLDADELFERKFKNEVGRLISDPNADGYVFRLYDFWDETHYRSDRFWCAHQYYKWLFLIRYRPSMAVQWSQSPQHCGRFPQLSLKNVKQSNLRVKHLGWSRDVDRHLKYERYQRLDPGAKYGWKEQYESILDPHPNLMIWKE